MTTVSKDIEQISAVLRAYQDGVNNASTEDCVTLFTQDCVVMPQHSPSCVGIAEVRKTFEGLFEMIKFDVKFDIQEVVPISQEYAFARKHRERICETLAADQIQVPTRRVPQSSRTMEKGLRPIRCCLSLERCWASSGRSHATVSRLPVHLGQQTRLAGSIRMTWVIRNTIEGDGERSGRIELGKECC